MRFRKKLVVFLTLLMVISSVLIVRAEENPQLPKAYVKVASRLNVREGPSTKNAIVSKLNSGDLVDVKETMENGWSKVVMDDGTEGYVSSKYIVVSEQDTSKYEMISAVVITAKNSSENRNFNMQKACESINGLILAPGEEFNWYNGVVGPASKANGYKEAKIILGGKYVNGYGGGVCQVSTAVYNCIYKLEIVPTELHHHSLPSSYIEKGMDATVSYPNKNFVFSNTKDYAIMFEAYTDGGQVIIIAYKVL